jgi:hypothetical protein
VALRKTHSPTVTRPSTVTLQKPLRDHFERGQRLHHLAASSAPDNLVELVPRRANVGAKANTLPFARCLCRLVTPTKTISTEHARARRRRQMGEEQCGPLRTLRCKTKALSKSTSLTSSPRTGGPCEFRPNVTGPVRISALQAVFVIVFTVMTVCNLLSWKYSGDKSGTRGHKRL